MHLLKHHDLVRHGLRAVWRVKLAIVVFIGLVRLKGLFLGVEYLVVCYEDLLADFAGSFGERDFANLYLVSSKHVYFSVVGSLVGVGC